jgi:hypothetical protein
MRQATAPIRSLRRHARWLAAVWALFWVVAAFQPCVMAAGLSHGGADTGAETAVAAPAGGETAASAPCLHCDLPDFQPVAPMELPAAAAIGPLPAFAQDSAAGPVLALAGADPPPQRTPTYLRLRVLRL